MIDIEKKLNELPSAKLSKKADYRLRFSFFKLKWQKRFDNLNATFSVGRFAPVAITMILLLSLVCLPYYAYASENIVRGDILYPVKQGIERIELGLADTPTKKVAVLTKLAERRLAEVEKLSEKDTIEANDNLAATIDEITNLTVQANSEAEEKINSEEKKQVDNKIEQIKEKQLDKMEKIADKFGLQASDNLLDSLAIAIDDLKKDKQAKNGIYRTMKGIEISTSTQSYKLFPRGRASTSTSTIMSTSAMSSRPGKASIAKGQKVINESWDAAKERIGALKDDLMNEGVDNEDLDNLFAKLDDRLQKAQSAINLGNFNQANGLIKSTEALSNNAKHFLRFGFRATSTPLQATSALETATSSPNDWRVKMDKKIDDIRGEMRDRGNR